MVKQIIYHSVNPYGQNESSTVESGKNQKKYFFQKQTPLSWLLPSTLKWLENIYKFKVLVGVTSGLVWIYLLLFSNLFFCQRIPKCWIYSFYSFLWITFSTFCLYNYIYLTWLCTTLSHILFVRNYYQIFYEWVRLWNYGVNVSFCNSCTYIL